MARNPVLIIKALMFRVRVVAWGSGLKVCYVVAGCFKGSVVLEDDYGMGFHFIPKPVQNPRGTLKPQKEPFDGIHCCYWTYDSDPQTRKEAPKNLQVCPFVATIQIYHNSPTTLL